MLENNATNADPGRIINIGSVVGMVPQNSPTHAYDVSKAAVHHLTRKLASDLAPSQITVNAIAPGYFKTRMSDGLKMWGGTENAISKSIPLGRMGNEHDIAGACIYLCSQAGSWLTGVILNVDGGSIGGIQVQLQPHGTSNL